MKKYLLLVTILTMSVTLFAQDEEVKQKSFKEHLFSGGSISLAFANNSFLIGASPVLGYNLSGWADVGLVFNYNYNSYRDVYTFNDKLHQSVYGGGLFTRLFPLPFLFAQAQVEHNFIREKYIPVSGSGQAEQITKAEANSFLIGGGYASGRDRQNSRPFFYMAILFDIADNLYSPYTDAYGRTIPIIRAGIQVPLFRGK